MAKTSDEGLKITVQDITARSVTLHNGICYDDSTLHYNKDNITYKAHFSSFSDMSFLYAAGQGIKLVYTKKENNIFKYDIYQGEKVIAQLTIEPIQDLELYNKVEEYISREEKLELKTKLQDELIGQYQQHPDKKTLSYKEKIDYTTLLAKKITYKHNNLVLTTQQERDEGEEKGNSPDLKSKTKVDFKDGKVYFSETGAIACTNNENYIYVVDKNCNLYIRDRYEGKHSYFLKGKEGSAIYGHGRPTAAAGHININEEGKISSIDYDSGHYKSELNQLLLVAKEFKKLDLLSEDCIITRSILYPHGIYTPKDLDGIDSLEILGQYVDINDMEIN